MASSLAVFLAGYSAGLLVMLAAAYFVFGPKHAKNGYLAGYCDAHIDSRDETDALPERDPSRPWHDERWYPSVRRRVLEMQLDEPARDGDPHD